MVDAGRVAAVREHPRLQWNHTVASRGGGRSRWQRAIGSGLARAGKPPGRLVDDGAAAIGYLYLTLGSPWQLSCRGNRRFPADILRARVERRAPVSLPFPPNAELGCPATSPVLTELSIGRAIANEIRASTLRSTSWRPGVFRRQLTGTGIACPRSVGYRKGSCNVAVANPSAILSRARCS